MASLELESGNPEAAVALVLGELAVTTAPLTRSKLLPVAVESLLAVGRLDDARTAVEELRVLAESWSAPLHQARSLHAQGAVASASGDRTAARKLLTGAIDWWRKVPAPHDEALSRMLLGLADESAARTMHLEAALETFVRLGAARDPRRVLGYLGRSDVVDRVTMALMFTDIEGSTTMLAELGDAAWVEVLRRHDGCLRELFNRHRGEELLGTGDGFFVGFRDADDALDCAVEIQRTLKEVRVRVGVHFAEVNRDHNGFGGRGVHEAARIAALGAGGDVVVSVATLERASKPYTTGESKAVALKGLPGEMQVATSFWGKRGERFVGHRVQAEAEQSSQGRRPSGN